MHTYKSICINTFYTPSYAPLAAIVIPNLIAYAKKHGYRYFINETKDEKFHFVKTHDTRKLLDAFDKVFTIELDAMIMNHQIKVEDFMEDGKDFFVCKDVNNFNGGSFITRSTDFSKAWFDFINMHEANYGDEQNVMEDFCDNSMFKHKIKVLPHPSINSIPYEYYLPSFGRIGYKDGDVSVMPTEQEGNYVHGNFVAHLPGFTMAKRIEIFQELQKQIIL